MQHRPTTRVLAALELLQTHKRMSGAELAARLGVSVRTVRRYVAALEDIGIPIVADQGRDGAYTLVAGFKLPPMMFTDEEALAMAIGLLAVRELGVAEAVPAVDSAEAKLERVMPENVRRRLGDVSETVRLDIANPHRSDADVPLGALSAAARARRRIRIRYESPASGSTTRELDPYGLSYQRGRWYVVGMCHLRDDLRTFRLDRIAETVTLDTVFERPDGFDVLGYLARSFAEMPRAHAVEVLLHTDLATAQAQWICRYGYLEPRDGGVVLRARTDSVDCYARLLAGLPLEFEILAPSSLVAAMHDVAGRIGRALCAPAAGPEPPEPAL